MRYAENVDGRVDDAKNLGSFWDTKQAVAEAARLNDANANPMVFHEDDWLAQTDAVDDHALPIAYPASQSHEVEAGFVEIRRGDETRRVHVELSGPAAASGLSFSARGSGVKVRLDDAVSDYLDLDDPPTHLVVTPFGVERAE